MIASGSTFRPHPGRVISDLLRLLQDVQHGTEALVYSYHPREAAASSYLAIILGGLLVAYPGSSAQQRSQCSPRIIVDTGVGCGGLK